VHCVATEKQIRANRANAKKSTGPKTAAGRLKSSRNAVRHKLSVPLPDDVTTATTEAMVRLLVRDKTNEAQLAAATEVALAQQELLRIRAVRTEMAAQIRDLASADIETLRRLAALDRYERLALSKRRRASKRLRD
jgi:hypothetical protein